MKNGGGSDGMNDKCSSDWNTSTSGAFGRHSNPFDHSVFENQDCKQLTGFTAQKTYSMLKNWGSSFGSGESNSNGGLSNAERARIAVANSRFSSCNEFTFGINFREEKTPK